MTMKEELDGTRRAFVDGYTSARHDLDLLA